MGSKLALETVILRDVHTKEIIAEGDTDFLHLREGDSIEYSGCKLYVREIHRTMRRAGAFKKVTVIYDMVMED
jgi:hypothetical protein